MDAEKDSYLDKISSYSTVEHTGQSYALSDTIKVLTWFRTVMVCKNVNFPVINR